jgi:hypothetical protein
MQIMQGFYLSLNDTPKLLIREPSWQYNQISYKKTPNYT